jgi:GNAT superfamily N-acetyltransferase
MDSKSPEEPAPVGIHRFDGRPLFTAGSFRAFEMDTRDIPALQRFFERNPEYHLAVGGQAPRPNEAQEEFESLPPAGWPFEKRLLLAFVDDEHSMVGMASVTVNLFVQGIWHVGLFIVATSLRGRGTASILYGHLESWMRSNGARWLRLGVVEGNARAERFWAKAGYVEVRKRQGVEIGKRVCTLRVMVKPPANGSLPEYIAMVARDRPDSA